MRNNILLVLFSLFISCSTTKKWAATSAQEEVWQIIVKTEKKLKNKGFVDNQKVAKIAHISNISPKNEVMGHQVCYNVEEKDIISWKDWFAKNKEKISYYKNDDVYKYYFGNSKEKIIAFEYETNKFKYSFSEPEMKRILETSEIIKKAKLNRNQNSKR